MTGSDGCSTFRQHQSMTRSSVKDLSPTLRPKCSLSLQSEDTPAQIMFASVSQMTSPGIRWTKNTREGQEESRRWRRLEKVGRWRNLFQILPNIQLQRCLHSHVSQVNVAF